MRKRMGKPYGKMLAVFLCVAMILGSTMTVLAEDETDGSGQSAIDAQTSAEVSANENGEADNNGEGSASEEVSDEKIADVPAAAANGDTDNSDANEASDSEAGIMALAADDELNDGVNIIDQGATGVTYNIDTGKAVMIAGTDSEPIVFKDCTFQMSGATVKLSGNKTDSDGQTIHYNNGETITKLWIGKNVQFDNCKFITESGEKSSTAGYDACIYFFSGNIVLNNCTLTGTNYQGQFLGLYGSSGSVTFNKSEISTVGNTGGWSYAMYAKSVLNLNESTMTATGMKRAVGGGNVNAFYSGDLSTNYDAINVTDSTIDFSDNGGGGFAINWVNIHVDNSKIIVNDNAGNATNSGVWYVKDSTIQMNGNTTHGWSHVGSTVENSTIECLHNGYAGYYITTNSSYTNCKVDIRCNGEKSLNYSAGDVWLNAHTATFTNCEHVWLGAVGRTGAVVNNDCEYFVAYDLYENKTKSKTAPVLEGVTLSEQDKHILFLNPSKDFDYARGDTEGKEGNSNDDDLFSDVAKETVIGKETAKIGTLTTAQLSHHLYDWEKGEVTDKANEDSYGVKRYECVDTCAEHVGWKESHPNSFNCNGTYVYAPLVGLTFEANAEDVTNMPEAQTEIDYKGNAKEPEAPVREGYVFKGWYIDSECTQEFDFSSELKENWTVVYAGWEKAPEEVTDPDNNPTDPEEITDPADTVKPVKADQTSETKEAKAAKTGDTNHIVLVLILMAAAFTVIICIRKRCRR